MRTRGATAAVGLLLLSSCGGSSAPRAAGGSTTATSFPAVTTFSLRPVESTSPPPCRHPLVGGTAGHPECYRLAAAIVGTTDVESAQAVYDRTQRQWVVDVTVTRAAAPLFEAAMRHDVGRDVAIVIDGRVVAVPRINAGITSRDISISADFDQQTAERIASGLTKPVPADPRRHASVCTRADLDGGPLPPLPQYRRLATAGTYWFGRVRLTPPATGAQPTVSEAQAWGAADPNAAGVYRVVLASWTSDAGFVMESNGKPAPHERVLAWVIIGTHVPVAASDVSGGATAVRGVPCYFGTSIAAVDATTGEETASASDYSG